MRKQHNRRRWVLAAAVAGVGSVFACDALRAATRTWDGSDGANWSTANNWSEGALAADGTDQLVFTAASPGNLSNSNDLAGLNLTSLAFNTNTTGPVTLSGNAFTLTGGLTNSNTTAGRNVTINNHITVSGAQSWLTNANSNSILIIGGNLSGTGNITVTGGNTSNSSTPPNLRLTGSNSGYTGTLDVGSSSYGVLLGSPSAMTGGLIDLDTSNANLWLTAGAGTYTFGIDGTQTTGARVKFRAAGTAGLYLTGGNVTWDPGNGSNYNWSGTSNTTIDFNGSNDSTARTLDLGNSSNQFIISGASKTFRNAAGGNNPGRVTLLSALADGNEGTARTLSTSLGLLVLTQAAVNVHATNRLGLSVTGGATAISNVNQLPGGNLNINGGVLLLDNVSWSAFTSARTAGTGNGQFQLTSGGFAARGAALTIDTTGTTSSSFDKSYTFGSTVRGTDGAFYANASVDISRDTTLTASRTWTIAHTGPGLTGSLTNSVRPVQRYSGNLSGSGSLQIAGNASGANTVFANAVGELVLAGSNTWTGAPSANLNGYLNAGPVGLTMGGGEVFIRLGNAAALSTGDGSTPFQWFAGRHNNGHSTESNAYLGGFMFTGSSSGVSYTLPNYFRLVLGFAEGNNNRPMSFGATSEAVANGRTTLADAAILINAQIAQATDVGLLVRDGSFTLGDAANGKSVRFIPTQGEDAASSSTRTALGLTASSRAIVKRGEGTVVLNNVAYTDLGVAGSGGPTHAAGQGLAADGTLSGNTASQFTWLIGRNANAASATTVQFDGAVRESATSGNSGSLAGMTNGYQLRGGVIEIDEDVYGGSGFTRTITSTNAAGTINFGNGGGGFAAIDGDVTLNLDNGSTSPVKQIGWGTSAGTNTSILPTGAQLIFGSRTADSTVILQNNITFGTPGAGTASTRVIQVMRGTSATKAEVDITGIVGGNSQPLGDNPNKAIYIIGDGRIRFSNGANAFGGGTFGVLGGTLLLAASDGSGGQTVLGGTHSTGGVVLGDTQAQSVTGNLDAAILTDAAVTINRAITVQAGNAGTATLGGNSNHDSTFGGTITLNKALRVTSATTGSNKTTFSGDITGGSGVTKVGTGTVDFSTAKTYTGATTVAAGTLLVNSTLASSGVTVEADGMLGGSGTVAGLVVNAGGEVAPGNSPGTLNVSGNVDFAAGSSLLVELQGTSADLLNVTGATTVDVDGLDIVLSGSPILTEYMVLDSNVGISGSVASVTGLSGWSAQLRDGDTQLWVVVPEPASAASILVLGGLGLLARRRRCR